MLSNSYIAIQIINDKRYTIKKKELQILKHEYKFV